MLWLELLLRYTVLLAHQGAEYARSVDTDHIFHPSLFDPQCMDKGGATRGVEEVDVQRMAELCEQHGISPTAVEQALMVSACRLPSPPNLSTSPPRHSQIMPPISITDCPYSRLCTSTSSFARPNPAATVQPTTRPKLRTPHPAGCPPPRRPYAAPRLPVERTRCVVLPWRARARKAAPWEMVVGGAFWPGVERGLGGTAFRRLLHPFLPHPPTCRGA
jgi:hypothetical protein